MSSDLDTTIEFVDGYTITKTGTCENRFAGKHKEAALQIGLLQSALEQAKAIVAALPKCNRLVDGNLVCDKPVVPNGHYWLVCKFTGIRSCSVMGIRLSRKTRSGIIIDVLVAASPPYLQGNNRSVPGELLHNSLEAAEAAGGK